MSKQNATFYADGMTCLSCEKRILQRLKALEGILSVDVRLQGGKITLSYDDALVGLPAIKAAVENAGYSVREKRGAGTALPVGIGLLLAAVYLLAGSSGLFSSIPKIDASIGFAMLFVVGLLTSVHCVAMCGGIALSQNLAEFSIYPGLLYNAGRILSYTVIGGIVGAVGSAFSFSPVVKGIIAGAAGLFMVLTGLNMLGLIRIFPRLSNIVPEKAQGAFMKVSAPLRKGGPFAVGILNGLMPCGPLQTMQLYALGTGSALGGALSMFVFSLGTVPLMLLLGMGATLLPRKFFPVMARAGAVLVMFLGVVTFARAAGLAGIPVPELNGLQLTSNGSTSLPAVTEAAEGRIPASVRIKTTVSDGVQTVVTDFRDGNYVPFAAQAGIPLKWTIRIKAEDLTGCNNRIIVPGYGIEKALVPGDNLIEFTPKAEGTIPYSCWMGMIRSRIYVVKDGQ